MLLLLLLTGMHLAPHKTHHTRRHIIIIIESSLSHLVQPQCAHLKSVVHMNMVLLLLTGIHRSTR